MARPRAPTITIDTSPENPTSQPVPVPASPGFLGAPSTDRSLRPRGDSDTSTAQFVRSRGNSDAESSASDIITPVDPIPPSSPGLLSVPAAHSPVSARRSFDSSSQTYVATPSASFAGSVSDLLDDQNALNPDPDSDHATFNVENNVFSFSPGQLSKLIPDKSFAALHALRSVEGLEKGLHTDLRVGLGAGEDFSDRIRVFSDNRLPQKKAKNFFQLMWMAYNDKVLMLLTGAAVISLAIGIYQAVQPDGKPEWIEGVAIVVAIALVVLVGAANDWQKERQFVELNKAKDDTFVRVKRSNATQEISVHDVLVGDIVLLESGDVIPADGVFISGYNLLCDEASLTGESAQVRKTPSSEVYRLLEARQRVDKCDPFILSGTTVAEGCGEYLVTATGVNSAYGKLMKSVQTEAEVTPLQKKLAVLAKQIAWIGTIAAILYFLVTFIEFLVSITHGDNQNDSPADKGQTFLNIFVVSVSIIVVAVPEGLPLAVTLALAFATKRMLKENNLVRYLQSCEVMGNATCICSDKTGTLTENNMTVIAGTLWLLSGKKQFGKDLKDPETFSQELDADSKSFLVQSIVRNTTAWELDQHNIQQGPGAFKGSHTETALLSFARSHLGMGLLSFERDRHGDCVWFAPFHSSRKCSAAVLKQGDGYRLMVKGAPEVLIDFCVPTEATSEAADVVSNYASQALRTIGFAYKDLRKWPKGPDVALEDVAHGMTMVGIVGIQDPLRPGVENAVADCKRAGIKVRMVTGDNLQTAVAIARECHILTEDGIAIDGPTFRRLSPAALDSTIPRIDVLARSSPDDKRILVKWLKEHGETVAVTGDGTNDAPALKIADVGFSMGISGTGVAKEASDIILMDDNFSSIVKAIKWGRAINDAVKKFLQFQVTVNITAVITTFVSGVATDNTDVVLTAVQLLWVNLIMDTFAALALATDPPPDSVLDRQPDTKGDALITAIMWKQILGQAVYQLVVILTLFFRGNELLGYSLDVQRTVIFNSFVWIQIFNTLNCRRLDNRLNVLEGILGNWLFAVILAVMIGGQLLIVFVGGTALTVVPLNGAQWGISLIIGFLALVVGMLLRFIPDPPEKYVPRLSRLRRKKQRDREASVGMRPVSSPRPSTAERALVGGVMPSASQSMDGARETPEVTR